MNLVCSDAGTLRGRHYHKTTVECFVILSGHIHVVFRKPVGDGVWQEISHDFSSGDVFIVEPLVEHTFYVKEKAQWINLLSQPVDPQEPDFYRYE